MKYIIRHWFGRVPPVPEALGMKEHAMGIEGHRLHTIEIEDLHEFVKKHGPIQLRPPKADDGGLFTIFVTDNGKFNQK